MDARHWLSYSHSDQGLFRNAQLDDSWDTLVVPGTLATFYFEGTGGFVLAQRAPYVIDPRTPLIQTSLELKRSPPRASHLKLLEIHDPEPAAWWPEREIPREHWEDGRWPAVVERVLDFQARYSTSATAKLDKYERLKAEARGETVPTTRETDEPARFVPPYWAVQGSADPWWALTREAIELAVDAHGARVQPLLAIREDVPASVLSELIADLPEGLTDVFCWKGAWVEAKATDADVAGWVDAIRVARGRGISVTNLYGGFLSALMLPLGLAGFGHGVGYSEARDTRRLGETGAAETRYYVPAVHAFLTVPSAQPLIDHLPAAWSCRCSVCESVSVDGRPAIARLSQEQRKAHFLLCRRDEIEAVERDPRAVLAQVEEVANWLAQNPLPPINTNRLVQPLRAWHAAIAPRLA
jgi:hypothetical protein